MCSRVKPKFQNTQNRNFVYFLRVLYLVFHTEKGTYVRRPKVLENMVLSERYGHRREWISGDRGRLRNGELHDL